MEFLEKPLEEAVNRGIKAAIVHFGKSEIQIGMVFRIHRGHAVSGTRQARFRDGCGHEGIATAYGKSAIGGEYSHNRGFVILMDYIKHGAYSMKSVTIQPR